MKLHAVRAYFIRHRNLLHYSKDSLRARIIPGFLSGHLNARAQPLAGQTCRPRSGEVRSSAALSNRRSCTGI